MLGCFVDCLCFPLALRMGSTYVGGLASSLGAGWWWFGGIYGYLFVYVFGVLGGICGFGLVVCLAGSGFGCNCGLSVGFCLLRLIVVFPHCFVLWVGGCGLVCGSLL